MPSNGNSDKSEVADKVREIKKQDEKGLTYTDRLITQLGVENGERARFLFKELQELKTQERKRAYYQEMKDKGIITKRVGDQIKFLLLKEK